MFSEREYRVLIAWSGWSSERTTCSWSLTGRVVRSADGYRRAINELAYQHHVRDTTGALFRVHPHGFRHTVGTRMINNDVPQRVVQQFLGHETPAMTARYAHIHDSTMKRKLAEYRGKVVDITGKVVEGDGPPISSDALWLKRSLSAVNALAPQSGGAKALVGGSSRRAGWALPRFWKRRRSSRAHRLSERPMLQRTPFCAPFGSASACSTTNDGDYSPASNNSRSASNCSTASCTPSESIRTQLLPRLPRPGETRSWPVAGVGARRWSSMLPSLHGDHAPTH